MTAFIGAQPQPGVASGGCAEHPRSVAANPELTFASVGSKARPAPALAAPEPQSTDWKMKQRKAQHFISPDIKSKLIYQRLNLLREVTLRDRCVNEVRE